MSNTLRFKKEKEGLAKLIKLDYHKTGLKPTTNGIFIYFSKKSAVSQIKIKSKMFQELKTQLKYVND